MSETHAPGPGVARHYLHEHEDVRAENPADGQVPVWNEGTQSFDMGAPVETLTGLPQAVAGTRDDPESALATLLTALAAAGIITDSTTAT